MANRFAVSRCCCGEDEVGNIYIGRVGGQIAFDYFITGRHLVQLGTMAYVDDIPTSFWSSQGAVFGIANCTIPHAATILDATVTFTVTTTQSDTPFGLHIIGDKAAHSTPHVVNFYLYESNKTNNYVEWWQTGVTWNTGVDIITPDITSVIQEIVDAATWASGNTMYVYFKGINGARYIQVYDSELTVTYLA